MQAVDYARARNVPAVAITDSAVAGANALKALEETAAQLAAFHVHYDPKHREKPA